MDSAMDKDSTFAGRRTLPSRKANDSGLLDEATLDGVAGGIPQQPTQQTTVTPRDSPRP